MSLTKVFGVRIRDATDETLEPFDHETHFVDQKEAIRRRNEYNSTGLYKAEVFVKELEL